MLYLYVYFGDSRKGIPLCEDTRGYREYLTSHIMYMIT